MRKRTQVIGDRRVVNPRTTTAYLRDSQANITDRVELSMETCGCGYSMARAGVGYRDPRGWLCKRCGQLHTLDRGAGLQETARLRPDPGMMRQFDLRSGRSPRRGLPAICSQPEDLETQR